MFSFLSQLEELSFCLYFVPTAMLLIWPLALQRQVKTKSITGLGMMLCGVASLQAQTGVAELT
jgi:hypothetical protein